MDDTTRQKVKESPEERKRRIRRQRMIQERRRRRRRKALILRGILVLIFVLILVGIGSAVSCGVKKYRQSAAGKKDSKKQETQVTEETVQMEAVDLKKVRKSDRGYRSGFRTGRQQCRNDTGSDPRDGG